MIPRWKFNNLFEVYYYKKLINLKGMEDVPEIDQSYSRFIILLRLLATTILWDGDYGDDQIVCSDDDSVGNNSRFS